MVIHSVYFEYEWCDAYNPGQWMRTHGNEHWEFDDDGLMRRRDMSANDYPIEEIVVHIDQGILLCHASVKPANFVISEQHVPVARHALRSRP